jgi:DNA polymerase-3 subunit epsilon
MSRRPASDQGRRALSASRPLAVGDDGNVERSVSTLLNPGVDPGPTHVHGLTAEMLEGQPCFADVAPKIVDVLRGPHSGRPQTSASTTRSWRPRRSWSESNCRSTRDVHGRVGPSARPRLRNLRLETLAAHYDISQMKPHDALDDALVLAQISSRRWSGARAQGLAAAAPRRAAALAQRVGHPRGASSAEDDRVADTV